MIAIGISATPIFIRLTRAQVLAVKVEDYVEAARAVGNSHLRIALRHILPNVVAPLIVQATLAIAAAVIAEASLSFLGLGQQPPAPSWGSMLNTAKNYIDNAPWMAVWPGLSIFLLVLSFNLLGDGLRDALDPRHKIAARLRIKHIRVPVEPARQVARNAAALPQPSEELLDVLGQPVTVFASEADVEVIALRETPAVALEVGAEVDLHHVLRNAACAAFARRQAKLDFLRAMMVSLPRKPPRSVRATGQKCPPAPTTSGVLILPFTSHAPPSRTMLLTGSPSPRRARERCSR